MENIGIGMKCYGHIELGGKKLYFENKVDSSFLLALQYQVDRQGLSKDTTNNQYIPMHVKATTFSLLSDEVDSTMTKIYNGLGVANLENLKCVQANLLKTTLKGSGTINKSGIVRSAGFNVLQFNSVSPIPEVNSIQRRVDLSLSNMETLPISEWFYVEFKKAFYGYGNDKIYKLPYDIDTGILGKYQVVCDTWHNPNSSSSYVFTNEKDKLISMYSDEFKVFDLVTDSLIVNMKIPYLSPEKGRIAWDRDNQVIRCGVNVYSYSEGQYYDGFTIDLNGNVNFNTGTMFMGNGYTDILLFRDNFKIETGGTMYRNSDIMDICGRTQYNGLLKKENNIMNNNKTFIFGSFQQHTSTLVLNFLKDFDSSLTILPVEPTQVHLGDIFGIEYIFEIMDTR